jgi:hypothetical protein
LVVFISPETAPASAAEMPEMTVVVIGVLSSPPPTDIRIAGPRTTCR